MQTFLMDGNLGYLSPQTVQIQAFWPYESLIEIEGILKSPPRAERSVSGAVNSILNTTHKKLGVKEIAWLDFHLGVTRLTGSKRAAIDKNEALWNARVATDLITFEYLFPSADGEFEVPVLIMGRVLNVDPKRKLAKILRIGDNQAKTYRIDQIAAVEKPPRLGELPLRTLFWLFDFVPNPNGTMTVIVRASWFPRMVIPVTTRRKSAKKPARQAFDPDENFEPLRLGKYED